MLAKMETFYLGILRVVILIVATIALVIAALGLISGIPPLLKQLGVSSETFHGGTLGEFVQEKKLTSATATSSNEAAAPVANTPSVDPKIADAAKEIHLYTASGDNPSLALWQQMLTASADRVTPDQRSAYIKSLKDLTDQLRDSHGRKLTATQVGELIDWHQQKFQTAAGEQAAKQASDGAKAYLAMGAAGAAFFLFILITFTFLFVKIERSLRLVRTVEVGEYDA